MRRFLVTYLALCALVWGALSALPERHALAGFPTLLGVGAPPVSGGGGNTVTFDAQATAAVTGNGVATVTNNNLTIGALNATTLAAIVAFNQSTQPTSLALTWNAVSMTQAATGGVAGLNGWNAIYCLAAPATGNHALTATWTGNLQVYIDGLSFTNTDQTGGTTTCPHGTSNTASAATATVTVTSQTNNKVIGVHQQASGTWGTISGNTIHTSTALTLNYASNYDVGAATQNVTAGISASGQFISVGVDLLHN